MPTYLPIPFAYWPRTEQDLATLGERLGGSASLRIATAKVVRHVKGEPAPRPVPEFIEWWLEFPAEFNPPGTPPPAPADDRTRELLAHAARIAALAWAKEIKAAKGWEPEPPPLLAPTGAAPPIPFVPAGKITGAK
jgi:hypothetical protein